MTSMSAGECCLYNRPISKLDPSHFTMFRIVAPDQYRRMPWKNGGGTTHEIAAHPEDSALDTFDWRVSIAEVARDGPFSRFPGIDRTITLIDGAGMRLSGNHRQVLLGAFEPYAFDGGTPVDCALVSGPVRDFNAMVRRERARGNVTVVRRKAVLDPADFLLAFAAVGAHECEVDGAPPMRLAPHHTLVVDRRAREAAGPIAIRPLEAGSVALAVRIECR
jgi:environmental stress-induced protein Ves